MYGIVRSNFSVGAEASVVVAGLTRRLPVDLYSYWLREVLLGVAVACGGDNKTPRFALCCPRKFSGILRWAFYWASSVRLLVTTWQHGGFHVTNH